MRLTRQMSEGRKERHSSEREWGDDRSRGHPGKEGFPAGKPRQDSDPYRDMDGKVERQVG